MRVARAVLYDFSDLGRGSTMRLLDASGAIVLQGYLPGCSEASRDVCLAIACACKVTLEVIGAPEDAPAPVATLDRTSKYEVRRPATEVIKGKATGQCLLF